VTPEGFFELADVRRIHIDQLDRYGGADGVRDQGLLESALAMPLAGFGGELLHPTVFEQAAAYLFHIVKNHPFIDGNKRTGTATALVFLHLNGQEIDSESAPLYDLVIGVAESRVEKEEVAAFFRHHARPVA
jgi:death-on-curing protein